MGARYVVVPATPRETGSERHGDRYYASTEPSGFDLYDNKAKCRLPLSCATRAEADRLCEVKNAEQLFSSSY